MQEERQQILQMLQDGKITTDQAMALLQALEEGGAHDEAEAAGREPLRGEIVSPEGPPDMARFRRFWQIPFFVAMALLIVFGFWLRTIYQGSEGAITLAFMCVWSLFLLAFVLTVLAWWSRRAPWLHVRVREHGGKRIAISFPLPLGLAGWGVRVARSWADASTQAHLNMAESFLAAAQAGWREGDTEPMVVHVDDEDGDQVQVYIG